MSAREDSQREQHSVQNGEKRVGEGTKPKKNRNRASRSAQWLYVPEDAWKNMSPTDRTRLVEERRRKKLERQGLLDSNDKSPVPQSGASPQVQTNDNSDIFLGGKLVTSASRATIFRMPQLKEKKKASEQKVVEPPFNAKECDPNSVCNACNDEEKKVEENRPCVWFVRVRKCKPKVKAKKNSEWVDFLRSRADVWIEGCEIKCTRWLKNEVVLHLTLPISVDAGKGNRNWTIWESAPISLALTRLGFQILLDHEGAPKLARKILQNIKNPPLCVAIGKTNLLVATFDGPPTDIMEATHLVYIGVKFLERQQRSQLECPRCGGRGHGRKKCEEFWKRTPHGEIRKLALKLQSQMPKEDASSAPKALETKDKPRNSSLNTNPALARSLR